MAKRKRQKATDAAIDTAAAAGGAGVALAVPGIPPELVAGAAGVALRTTLQWVETVYTERQRARVSVVIAQAAKEAGLDPKELVDRLDADPDREELFVRTLRAAQDAGVAEKLVALGKALAAGAVTDDPVTVQWEVAFVQALADLDRSHVRVLEVFTWTAEMLGADQLAPDVVPPLIKQDLLGRQVPDLAPVLGPLLATLQRYGLAVPAQPETHGMTFGSPGGPLEDWHLTRFGERFLQRMREVGETLADEGVMRDSP